MKRVIQSLFYLIGCILLCGCQTNKKDGALIPVVGNKVTAFVTNEEKGKGILCDDVVLDLGNHKVAYIVQDSRLTSTTGFDLHLAIEELETKKVLYIPCLSLDIEEMEVINDLLIKIKYIGTRDEKIWQIPPLFFQGDGIKACIYPEKLILNSEGEGEFVKSEEIWEREIELDGNLYTLTWERIGQTYREITEVNEGYYGAYRLTVIDGLGEVICQQLVANYPLPNEEVCWVKDISGDGNEDIILGKEFSRGRELYASLLFLVWNQHEKKFEDKSITKVMGMPQWNEKLQTLMFFTESFYSSWNDMQMYQLQTDGWELYAEHLIDTDEGIPRRFEDINQKEKFYEELDIYRREIFYKNRKIISNEITDKNWWNKESIWYIDNPDNLKLYPEGWEYKKAVLPTGEEFYKYIKP